MSLRRRVRVIGPYLRRFFIRHKQNRGYSDNYLLKHGLPWRIVIRQAIKKWPPRGNNTAATSNNVVPEIRQEGRCWLKVSSIAELSSYFIQTSIDPKGQTGRAALNTRPRPCAGVFCSMQVRNRLVASTYGFRSFRTCLFSHPIHSQRVAGERDLGPVSPV